MWLLAWIFQILLLTAVIHVFLRFVRTTRGNRLIQGLFLSVLVGVVGLWGVSTVLDLEELKYLLERSTGFIVIGLAIIFQPELRRGIAQLGERVSARRLGRPPSPDAIAGVTRAISSLAARRYGALIVFERESSLQTVLETGTSFQAEANPRLIESLFHPGGALHDGALILRQGRIVAAGCFLPLAEGYELDHSLGTRHRAALGLSEESDAVIAVSSEETGSISLAHDGRIQQVSHDELERELRALLGSRYSQDSRRSRQVPAFLPALRRALRRDVGWIIGSLLLATAVWYAAHLSILETREFSVEIVDASSVHRRSPKEGEILVISLEDGVRVHPSEPGARYRVAVTGSRGQFASLGGSLCGTLVIEDAAWEGGPLDLDHVSWEASGSGLQYSWKAGQEPELLVERFGIKRVELEPAHVRIDARELDPRFQVLLSGIEFRPQTLVEVRGPSAHIDALDETDSFLEPIVMRPEDRGKVIERIRLSKEHVDEGLSLSDRIPIEVVLPIVPVQREAGTITQEIALVCLSPARAGELERWVIPPDARSARFTIVTSGLIPGNIDPNSSEFRERAAAIRRFVERNLCAYLDVAEITSGGDSCSLPVRWTWRADWREAPAALGLSGGTLGDLEALDVRLESELLVQLEGKHPTRSSGGND